jgi:hypothetical protein
MFFVTKLNLSAPHSRAMNHQLAPNNGNSGNMPPSMASNVMNRPASAYFNNNSNNSNVMNLSSPSTPNIPNTSQQQSTSTSNLMQVNPSVMMGYAHNTNNMMPSPAQAHISHPNLSGMSNASSSITNSPITAHRPPMMPNKQQQQQQQQGNFSREAQSQHSLRSQQQMMAPSMPNIPHASGYAATIPASQSMQNVNQVPGNYQMFQLQQQQQEPQLSPNQQASLLRGTAKMAEMGELLKRQQRNQQQQMANGPIHYTNSMDNIHIPQANPAVPQMLSPHTQQQQRQVFHPQSPQKQLPTTAPKPQV